MVYVFLAWLLFRGQQPSSITQILLTNTLLFCTAFLSVIDMSIYTGCTLYKMPVQNVERSRESYSWFVMCKWRSLGKGKAVYTLLGDRRYRSWQAFMCFTKITVFDFRGHLRRLRWPPGTEVPAKLLDLSVIKSNWAQWVQFDFCGYIKCRLCLLSYFYYNSADAEMPW